MEGHEEVAHAASQMNTKTLVESRAAHVYRRTMSNVHAH
jgi:hypothetical protein